MEHKVNDIITYNHNGETIYLKVIEDFDCKNCFFYSAACCSDIINNIGDCLDIRRTDKIPVIFKKVNNKTMNENIDLKKILKDCPKGFKLYSLVHGEVTFLGIRDISSIYSINVKVDDLGVSYTFDGKIDHHYKGECVLFPSKEQRDWSKFTAPWYKKDKFDPNTLNPFDRVLTRTFEDERWDINFYSSNNPNLPFPYTCIDESYKYCIPYNDETKHLVGTTDEAPEYYRYWEK